MPQKYSAIFMSGQGLAGTFAAIAMLLAIGSKSHNASRLPKHLDFIQVHKYTNYSHCPHDPI